jgi:hypothetical protein
MKKNISLEQQSQGKRVLIKTQVMGFSVQGSGLKNPKQDQCRDSGNHYGTNAVSPYG